MLFEEKEQKSNELARTAEQAGKKGRARLRTNEGRRIFDLWDFGKRTEEGEEVEETCFLEEVFGFKRDERKRDRVEAPGGWVLNEPDRNKSCFKSVP